MSEENKKDTIEKVQNDVSTNTKSEKKVEEKPKKKSKNRMYIVLLFIVIVAIVGYVIFRGEYLEVLEIGEEYIGIFWQNVNYTAITFGINFIFLFIVIYANNNRIKKALKPFFESEKKTMPKLPNKSLSFILSVVVSAITTELILNQYMLFVNNTSFGQSDPVFGMDIGYFMFQKPFIETLLLYAMLLIVGLTIYTVVYYIAVFNIYFDGVDRETLKKSKLLKQLFTNIKVLAVVLAGFVFIKTQDIGFDKFLNLQEDTTYSIYGAGVTKYKKNGKVIDVIPGTAHFLEHRIMDFTKNKKAMKLINDLGSMPNAYTMHDITNYNIFGGTDLIKNLKLLLDRVFKPNIKEDDVISEKGIIGEEIDMEQDNINTVLLYSAMNNTFKKDKSMCIPVLGEKADIEKITSEYLIGI